MTMRINADIHGNAEAEDIGGGGLRLTHGVQPESTSNLQPEGMGPRVQINDAGSRLVLSSHGGELAAEQVANTHGITAADLRAGRPDTILGSARDSFGIPTEASRMHGGTIVDVPGFGETSLEVAEHLGYVQRGPDGMYREVPQTDTHTVEDKQTNEHANAVPFDSNAESVFRDLASAYAPALQSALVEHLIAGTLERDVNDLAAVGGMSPDELRAKMTTVERAFNVQLNQVASNMCEQPEEFYSWMRENHPDWAMDLMRQHAYTRNPQVWQQAVREFLRNEPPSAEALRDAGYEVRTTADGEDIVVIDGQEYLVAVAARMDLI